MPTNTRITAASRILEATVPFRTRLRGATGRSCETEATSVDSLQVGAELTARTVVRHAVQLAQ